MEQVFYAMPRWYFFLTLLSSCGVGIFFTILYVLFGGKLSGEKYEQIASKLYRSRIAMSKTI